MVKKKYCKFKRCGKVFDKMVTPFGEEYCSYQCLYAAKGWNDYYRKLKYNECQECHSDHAHAKVTVRGNTALSFRKTDVCPKCFIRLESRNLLINGISYEKLKSEKNKFKLGPSPNAAFYSRIG